MIWYILCIKIYNRQFISLDPDSDRAVFIWATIPEIPRQTSDKKTKRATKNSSNCRPAGTTALCWRSPGVVKKLWRRDEKVLYGTSSFLTPTKGNALRIFLPPTSKDCLFGFFLNCLDLDSHFELLHFFIFQSGGRLTSYHVTLKRCFCPQTSPIWILDPKCQKWLGFSMLVLLRGWHCMLAMSVFLGLYALWAWWFCFYQFWHFAIHGFNSWKANLRDSCLKSVREGAILRDRGVVLDRNPLFRQLVQMSSSYYYYILYYHQNHHYKYFEVLSYMEKTLLKSEMTTLQITYLIFWMLQMAKYLIYDFTLLSRTTQATLTTWSTWTTWTTWGLPPFDLQTLDLQFPWCV